MLITTDKVVRLRLTDGSEIVVERLPRGRLGVTAPKEVLIDTESNNERERSNTEAMRRAGAV